MQNKAFILRKALGFMYSEPQRKSKITLTSGCFERAFLDDDSCKVPCKSKPQHFHFHRLNVVILEASRAGVRLLHTAVSWGWALHGSWKERTFRGKACECLPVKGNSSEKEELHFLLSRSHRQHYKAFSFPVSCMSSKCFLCCIWNLPQLELLASCWQHLHFALPMSCALTDLGKGSQSSSSRTGRSRSAPALGLCLWQSQLTGLTSGSPPSALAQDYKCCVTLALPTDHYPVVLRVGGTWNFCLSDFPAVRSSRHCINSYVCSAENMTCRNGSIY